MLECIILLNSSMLYVTDVYTAEGNATRWNCHSEKSRINSTDIFTKMTKILLVTRAFLVLCCCEQRYTDELCYQQHHTPGECFVLVHNMPLLIGWWFVIGSPMRCGYWWENIRLSCILCYYYSECLWVCSVV